MAVLLPPKKVLGTPAVCTYAPPSAAILLDGADWAAKFPISKGRAAVPGVVSGDVA